MKRRIIITAISLVLVNMPGFAANAAVAPATAPQTTASAPSQAAKPIAAPVASGGLTADKDKFSYAIGFDLGEKLKSTGLEISPDLLTQAIKDAFSNANPLLTPAQRQEVIQKFQKQFMAKKQAELAQLSEKNKRDGDAFLAANKVKPGVKTTPSGLQYKVITEGTGAQPTDNDTVKVEYEGKLVNGQVFDSSYKRGQPIETKLTDVIAGWKEALKLMRVGSKWEVYIPASLAYGAGGPIGPNQTLTFNIKLDAINKPAAVVAATPATK